MIVLFVKETLKNYSIFLEKFMKACNIALFYILLGINIRDTICA